MIDDRKELRGKTYKVTDEVADMIAEITKKGNFTNINAAIEALINTYVQEESKVVYADRKTEIEAFQGFVNSASNIYFNSLEIAKMSTENARSEVAREITAKTNMIADLQEKNAEYKKEVEKLKDAHETIDALKSENEALKNIESKNEIILESNNSTIKELKSKVRDLEVTAIENNELKVNIKDLTDKKLELEIDLTEATKDLNRAIKEIEKIQLENMNLKDDLKSLELAKKAEIKEINEMNKAEIKEINEINKQQVKEINEINKAEIKALNEEIKNINIKNEEKLNSFEKKLKEQYELELNKAIENANKEIQFERRESELVKKELENELDKHKKLLDEITNKKSK